MDSLISISKVSSEKMIVRHLEGEKIDLVHDVQENGNKNTLQQWHKGSHEHNAHDHHICSTHMEQQKGPKKKNNMPMNALFRHIFGK